MLARDAERTDAPVACPGCSTELILRKGPIRIHHFAHKAPTSCRLGFGETQDHFQVKLAIFDGLRGQDNVTDLELEKRLAGSVADIYAVISGVPVAIEVQRSDLGIEGIAARTANYHRLGIAVIWVALSNGDLDFERYSPSAWERWCHAAYFGRVYYWSQGQALRPLHFAPFTLHVAYQSWRKDGESTALAATTNARSSG